MQSPFRLTQQPWCRLLPPLQQCNRRSFTRVRPGTVSSSVTGNSSWGAPSAGTSIAGGGKVTFKGCPPSSKTCVSAQCALSSGLIPANVDTGTNRDVDCREISPGDPRQECSESAE